MRALVILLSLWAGAAWAYEGKDSDKPLDISADNPAVYDKQTNTLLYTGNVIAIQGVNRIKCDWLKAYMRSHDDKRAAKHDDKTEKKSTSEDSPVASLYKIDAKGSVFLSSPDETAQGNNATYDVEHKQITMTGAIVLVRGPNIMEGSTLVVDTLTGKSVLDPDKGARVKGRLIPEKPTPETKPETKSDNSGAEK